MIDFTAFLEVANLLSNPAAYTAKIQELQKHSDLIRQNLNYQEDLSQIAKLKQETQKLLDEATAKVQEAKQTAATIIANAQDTLVRRTAELDELRANLATQQQSHSELKQALTEKSAALASKEQTLNDKEQALSSGHAALAVSKEEVESRLTTLRKVMG